jgi:CheY-like chemotaxis protein
MSTRTGPIILIEDDQDDQEMLREVFKDLDINNELKFFNNGNDGLNYLLTTTDKPLIIFSDINMPAMTGIELRKKINENDYLRKKSIPFVFLTTSERRDAVIEAYEMMVQGYFIKPNNLNEFKRIVRMVIDYWKVCKHPNT